MRVPLSWLREFAPVELEPEQLADVLTSRGAKVEGMDRPWAGLSGVVVARVTDKRPHPNSDRLTLARLDAGTGSGDARVAAGVANWEVGDLVAYAPPGARVPALDAPLATRTLRGELSEGMICSARELGVSGDHRGILVLPPNGLAPGDDVKKAFGLDDVVFDVEVKANRADLLCMVGLAREAASATGVPFVRPDVAVVEADESAGGAATVRILDTERCPRYLARVIRGVTVAPSPIAVQARLSAAGVRPVSNVVDATNYVMLEVGQPLHAFDLDRLAGHGIVVRRAEDGERLTTLDGDERVLTAEDLVIADLETAVAIAGVMGSGPTEVSPATSDVLLESAHFDRRGVIRTSRRLDLRTEASSRFERGVDPEGVPGAAARAAAMIGAWSGGSVLGGVVEAGGAPPRRHVRVRPDRASLLLGMPISPDAITESLARIEMPTSLTPGGPVEVEVPGWRPDVETEVDVIEEVIRVLGYDRIGATVPAVRQSGGVPDSYSLRRRIRRALVRGGLRETISYSFASEADLQLLGCPPQRAVRVRNPLAADDAFLRPSLVPGLLRALRTNRSRQVRTASLFEVGRVFELADSAGPVGHGVLERDAATFAMFGVPDPGLRGGGREVDFFDAKGALEELMATLGVTDWDLGGPAPAPYHPVRSAGVRVAGAGAGLLGELTPDVAERFDLPGRVAVAELDVGVLAAHATAIPGYADVPRYPPVRRDLAFVVPADIPTGHVEALIRSAGAPLVGSALLFDVFSGPPIPTGRTSVAFSVDFRAPDRTLTDAEADDAVRAIVERVAEELGGELRAG